MTERSGTPTTVVASVQASELDTSFVVAGEPRPRIPICRPEAERAYEESLCIRLYATMRTEHIERVCDVIISAVTG